MTERADEEQTTGAAPLREFDLIRWIRQQAPADERVVVGIGDDAAAVAVPGPAALLTTDLLVEGVHFDLAEASLGDVGWKSLACSVSDIAAMGGRASAAVVAVAVPRGFTAARGRALAAGLLACAREFGVCLVGGDLAVTPGPLVVSVAMMGETEGRPAVRRSGARPGDVVLVTGRLGGSRLGRHLRFRPRQAEALALCESYRPSAMIDISDGLAADLHHILEESGVGARLLAAEVPLSDDAHRAAQASGRSPLDHALGDGEDYELLFTLPPDQAARLLERPPFDVPVTQVGTVVASGAILALPDGSERPLERCGWEHTA
ncbi:MAG: thiamine-phosphate kinase [Candidatus Brocadiia bacterium]